MLPRLTSCGASRTVFPLCEHPVSATFCVTRRAAPSRCPLACASSRAHAHVGGRLVLNHSTHVEGLIPVLRRVAALPGVHAVVPGRLSTTRCSAEGLALRVTTRVPGGFKLLARRGTAVQEVFVTVDRGGSLAVDGDGGDDAEVFAEFSRAIDGVASLPTRGMGG